MTPESQNCEAISSSVQRESVRKLIFGPSNPPVRFIKTPHIENLIVTDCGVSTFHTGSQIVRHRLTHFEREAVFIANHVQNVGA